MPTLKQNGVRVSIAILYSCYFLPFWLKVCVMYNDCEYFTRGIGFLGAGRHDRWLVGLALELADESTANDHIALIENQ